MVTMAAEVDTLTTSPIHWFEEWPTGDLPRTGAVVYTVWHRDGRFIPSRGRALEPTHPARVAYSLPALASPSSAPSSNRRCLDVVLWAALSQECSTA